MYAPIAGPHVSPAVWRTLRRLVVDAALERGEGFGCDGELVMPLVLERRAEVEITRRTAPQLRARARRVHIAPEATSKSEQALEEFARRAVRS